MMITISILLLGGGEGGKFYPGEAGQGGGEGFPFYPGPNAPGGFIPYPANGGGEGGAFFPGGQGMYRILVFCL